jgi:hypothetical protein
MNPMHDPHLEPDLTPTDPRRLDAFHRYEQCLADGRTILMESYIEHLLVQSPFPLELLQDIISDLQNHLQTLRQQHFDMRERIIEALHKVYHVDITPLTPTNRWLDYHLLDVERVITMVHQGGFHLGREEAVILRDMLESSRQICGRLAHDIDLTERLCDMIHDWLVAYLPLHTASDVPSELRVQ